MWRAGEIMGINVAQLIKMAGRNGWPKYTGSWLG